VKTDDGEDQEQLLEEETEETKEKKWKFTFTGLNMVISFINGLIVSLTIRLHRVSRSYRYVMKVLAHEKKALKETPGFGAGIRTGSGMVWTPIQGSSRSARYVVWSQIGKLTVVSRSKLFNLFCTSKQ
jgi:hypothetical protein